MIKRGWRLSLQERADLRVYAYEFGKSVPQRLKPIVFRRVYGTAEPVPFVQRRFSLRLFAVARKSAASAECATFHCPATET
jgi:hypothetical protein